MDDADRRQHARAARRAGGAAARARGSRDQGIEPRMRLAQT